MDAKELFKQLSCGATFTKPITAKSYGVRNSMESKKFRLLIHSSSTVNFQQSATTSSYIKKEIKEEEPDVDSDISIKSEEDDSDNECHNQIQMLSDSAMPVQVSKKKKKVTAEQLKNWETEKVNRKRRAATFQSPIICLLRRYTQIADKSTEKQISHSCERIKPSRSARNVR